MLTRLEVDGFKNLQGFAVDFGPFTCIAGQNGVGKSNVFDAIELLALVADHPLLDAAGRLRSTREDGGGDPRSLFPGGEPGNGPIRLAAEMIVPDSVEDDFGAPAPATITFLRYELSIAYVAPDVGQLHPRLVVVHESLEPIKLGDAYRHLGFRYSAKEFRKAVVKGRRSGGAFISTEPDSARIIVHQDGGSHGRPRRGLPLNATTTVVSTINTADSPTILAARREMQGWRRLALEPTALRSSDRFTDPQTMTETGRHLAAALHRIGSSSDPSVDDPLARIAARLDGLAGLRVDSIRIDVDNTRQLLTLMVTGLDGHEFPARSLSEGTLRFLALCALLEDPTVHGLICMEEPENGIHPANLAEMVTLVRDLAVDPERPPGDDNPMRQVIVNTHSPGVVQLVSPDDLLLAATTTLAAAAGPREVLRTRGIIGSWRDQRDHNGVAKVSFTDYLLPPEGSQLHLSFQGDDAA